MAVDRVGPLLQAIATAEGAALVPPPGRLLVVPGEVPWDECCKGTAWTRLEQIEGTGPPTPCGPAFWLVTIGVGVLRCVAVIDDNGAAPLPGAVTADALQQSQDATNLAVALLCNDFPDVLALTMRQWEPLGPEGGCAGGEWHVDVKLLACACPP